MNIGIEPRWGPSVPIFQKLSLVKRRGKETSALGLDFVETEDL
jgi:hypothetical protein